MKSSVRKEKNPLKTATTVSIVGTGLSVFGGPAAGIAVNKLITEMTDNPIVGFASGCFAGGVTTLAGLWATGKIAGSVFMNGAVDSITASAEQMFAIDDDE